VSQFVTMNNDCENHHRDHDNRLEDLVQEPLDMRVCVNVVDMELV
jgi:hypothetical protein